MPNVTVDLPQDVLDYIDALIPKRFANRAHALRSLIEAGIVADAKRIVTDAVGRGHVTGPKGGVVPMLKLPRHLRAAMRRPKGR